MDEPNACANCKHFHRFQTQCCAPQARIFKDLVTGYLPCAREMRKNSSLNIDGASVPTCGFRAQWFEKGKMNYE